MVKVDGFIHFGWTPAAGDSSLFELIPKNIWIGKSPDFGEIENIPTVVDEIKKDISELTSVTSTEECVHLWPF